MPLQVSYGHNSVFYKEKEQFSLPSARLQELQYNNGQEQVFTPSYLGAHLTALRSKILYKIGCLLGFQQCPN